MNEFKLPRKKQWQTLSEDITKHGPLHGSGSPTFTPTAPGVVYVDVDGPAIYISSGISSSNDWRLVWD
jgi:hypothetical protein